MMVDCMFTYVFELEIIWGSMFYSRLNVSHVFYTSNKVLTYNLY